MVHDAVEASLRTIREADTLPEHKRSIESADSILADIEWAKRSIENNEADEAARFAWRAGFEFAFAVLRSRYETYSEHGEKDKKAKSNGGGSNFIERVTPALAAEEVERLTAKRGKAQAIRDAAKKLDVSESTIKRRQSEFSLNEK